MREKRTCSNCGESTIYTCERCHKPFCSDCCEQGVEGGGFYCISCYPFGTIVDWGTERDPRDGDTVKRGTRLHFRDCRILRSLWRSRKQGRNDPPYLWEFTTIAGGIKLLENATILPCKVCGTFLDRLKRMPK